MIDRSLEWERSHEFIDIDCKDAITKVKEILGREDECASTKLSGGLANSNYIITFANGDKYVLRLYARNKANAYSEYELMSLLKDEPYTPKYLSYHESDDLIEYPYAIMQYYEGKALSYYLADERYFTQLSGIYQDLGRFIKSLHNYNSTKSNLVTFESPINYIENKLAKQNVIDKLGSKLHDQIKYLISHADSIVDIKHNTMVHGDFKPANILIIEESNKLKLSVILDWEYAYIDHNLSDIATLFRFDDNSTNPLKNNFVMAYNEYGTRLPKNWQLQSKIIDLINLCDLLDSDHHRPRMYRDIAEIITNNLQYIEQC